MRILARVKRWWKARQARRDQRWEVVLCACDRPFMREAHVRHPATSCPTCEELAADLWIVRLRENRVIW